MTSQAYLTEFLEAQRFSVKSGLNPTQLQVPKPVLFRDAAESDVRQMMDTAYSCPEFGEGVKNTLKNSRFFKEAFSRVRQCVPVHLLAWVGLPDNLQRRSVLTIGFVEINGVVHYPVTQADLRLRAITKQGDLVQLHAWLTFDSGEIVDNSLAASMNAVKHSAFTRADEIIYGHPWNGRGIDYHPVATGAYWGELLGVLSFG